MLRQHAKRTTRIAAVMSLLLLTLAIYSPTMAQDIPLTIGSVGQGEISGASPTVRFAITSSVPQTVTIQVLAVTPGFAPSFNVIDPFSTIIQSAPNAAAQPIIEANANLSAPGTTIIEVAGVNGGVGQFVVNVSSNAALPPPIALVAGQAVPGSVNSQTPILLYSFGGLPSGQTLTVRSDVETSGPLVTLRNITTGETLASTHLNYGRFGIMADVNPAAPTSYEVELAFAAPSLGETYTICLEVIGGIACPIEPITPITQPVVTQEAAPPVTTGICQATANGQNVNVRSGPSTGYGVVATLLTGSPAPIVGRLADNSWYLVNVNGAVGWVAASVIVVSGDCSAVPPVAPPPAPPTAPPTATLAVTATATSTFTPTSTATNTNTPGTPSTRLPILTLIGPLDDLPVLEQVEPDLVLLTFNRNGSGPAPYAVPITFTLYIRNVGNGDAGPFTAQVILTKEGQSSVGSVSVPGLAGGADAVVNVSVTPQLYGEGVTVTYYLDSASQVAESSEGNNISVDPNGLTISPPA